MNKDSPVAGHATVGGSILADRLTRALQLLCAMVVVAGVGVIVPAVRYGWATSSALGVGLIVAGLIASYVAYRLRVRHEAIVRTQAGK